MCLPPFLIVYSLRFDLCVAFNDRYFKGFWFVENLKPTRADSCRATGSKIKKLSWVEPNHFDFSASSSAIFQAVLKWILIMNIWGCRISQMAQQKLKLKKTVFLSVFLLFFIHYRRTVSAKVTESIYDSLMPFSKTVSAFWITIQRLIEAHS